jgi:hypothetical protein
MKRMDFTILIAELLQDTTSKSVSVEANGLSATTILSTTSATPSRTSEKATATNSESSHATRLDLASLASPVSRLRPELSAVRNSHDNNSKAFLINCKYIVKPDPPDMPLADRVTKDSVTISWRPPRSDGGAKIKGYLIEKKGKGDKDWSEVNGTPCPATVYKV